MKVLKWIIVIVAIAVVAILIVRLGTSDKSVPTPETGTSSAGAAKQEISQMVISFGGRLKDVSLLSPTASSDIEREYGPYISRSLLSLWQSHPEEALGRQTSSPWPDRIEPIEITVEPSGIASVRALLVYMTSAEVSTGGNAGTSNLELSVIKEDGTWKIDTVAVTRTNGANAPLDESDRPQLE